MFSFAAARGCNTFKAATLLIQMEVCAFFSSVPKNCQTPRQEIYGGQVERVNNPPSAEATFLLW